MKLRQRNAAVKETVSSFCLSDFSPLQRHLFFEFEIIRILAHSIMGSSHHIPLLLVFAARLSASAFISDTVVGHQVVNERRLLQVNKPAACSVNIENQNYSIITSQCKDPYPTEPCCSAFKEFACPLAVQINDLTTDCADRMMSYITAVGKYPSGLFAGICRDDKEGLRCPASPPLATPNAAPSRLFMPLLLLFPLLFLV